jgi:hypothetical protein
MLLPLRGLGQVSINHAILWCKFGFHCDLELVGMLDQSISTPRATFAYTIWVMYNGTTLYSNSCVPQIAKLTPTNPNFIRWSLHLLKWVAFFWHECHASALTKICQCDTNWHIGLPHNASKGLGTFHYPSCANWLGFSKFSLFGMCLLPFTHFLGGGPSPTVGDVGLVPSYPKFAILSLKSICYIDHNYNSPHDHY